MTYEELKINLDIYDPIDVLQHVGLVYKPNRYFVVCDEGDCHLFKTNGEEDDINLVDELFGYTLSNITKIIIPPAVTRIANYTFRYCKNLVDVDFSDAKVTDIGDNAFLMCENLVDIALPDSVLNIGAKAFMKCSKLKNISIPPKIKRIYRNAFGICDNLSHIIFRGKTLSQVKAMDYYPWGIDDESIIECC